MCRIVMRMWLWRAESYSRITENLFARLPGVDMTRLRVCLLLSLLVVGCGFEQAEDPTVDRRVAELETPGSAEGSLVRLAEEYPERILPLVQKHCLKCHSAEKKKGGLDLARFGTVADVRSHSRTWQKVLRRLRDGEMPPRNTPQPSAADRMVRELPVGGCARPCR